MSAQIELLKEAHRRGILPENKRPLFDEAVKRGLITLDDQPQAAPPQPTQPADDVPQWGRDNPNIYGIMGAGKAILDTGKEALKSGLELVPMLAGGIIGGATAGPAGAVAGAGLGQGMLGQAERAARTVFQGQPADTVGDAALYGLRDVTQGASMEMGGQAIGPIVSAVRRLPVAVKAVKGTNTSAQRQAGEILTETRAPASNEALSVAEARNIERSNALLKRIGVDDLDFTPAQKSGSYKEAYLEQGIAAQNKDFASNLTVNDANLATRARNRAVGTLEEAAPITGKSATETGEQVVASLKRAKNPLEEVESKAWNSISKNYEMPTINIDRAFSELDAATIDPTLKSQIEGLKEFYGGTKKTVGDMREVLKAVTQRIDKARLAGEANDARIFGIIKKSFDDDFKSLAAAAKKGEIFEYNGKIVNPTILKEEIASATKRINEIESAGSVPDADAVLAAIRGRGFPSMRSPGEDAANFNKRMATDYKKYFGKEPPMIANPADAASLVAQQDKIARATEILNNMKPAKDVAKQIADANAATIEKQWRFGRGKTAEVMRYGNKDSGLKVDYAEVPTRYFNEAGAANLIKAVGKPEASRLMSDHVTTSLESMTKDGILNAKEALRFLDKNGRTLDRLGLKKDAEKLVADQLPNAIKARLNARLGEDRLGDLTNTLTDIKGIIRDFAPALNRTKGAGSKELNALLDYHQMLQTLGRNKAVSYSKGSNSAEKFFSSFEQAPEGSLAKKIIFNLTTAGATGGLAIGGPIGAIVGGTAGRTVKGVSDTITAHQREAVGKLLEEAISNPEAAKFLQKVARGYKPTAVEMEKEMTKHGIQWKAPDTASRLIGAQMAQD